MASSRAQLPPHRGSPRPVRRAPAPGRRPGLAALAVLVALAALVLALGGGQAAWLALPAALVLAALAPGPRAAALGAGAAGLVALAPELALDRLGPPPALGLFGAVLAASAGTLVGVRRRLEAERDRLRDSALRDPLTGLVNRRGLDERLGSEIARHARHGRRFALLALDLDGFKLVNDRFGHQAGDDVLRDVAVALLGAVREQDTVVRLGGDEFCVLAPETDPAGAARLAARIGAAVAGATAGLDGLGASVGAAVFPDDGDDGDALLAGADEAALDAKRERTRPARGVRRAA